MNKMSKITQKQYVASMVLAGVGDAMGYKCGDWEFNFVGEDIHKDVKKLGGIEKLKIKLPTFMVSDDTVLLLSTAEALVTVGAKDLQGDSYYQALYKEFAFRFQQDYLKDMNGRAAGACTGFAIHQLKPGRDDGWMLPFNARGGGCGAAMRAMCIGLRYPNVCDSVCMENLIRISVESGRMTHTHPTGYLGSFATALFGAMAVSGLPLKRWGSILMEMLPHVWRYVEKAGRDVEENRKAWSYFQEKWSNYLQLRNLQSGSDEPVFPTDYDVKTRDAYYKSVSYSGWGGSSGHDAPMIAYDALLSAGNDWVKLCHHGMLHGGDNDSTGVIAGFCYGVKNGFNGVPECNHKNVEKRTRLEKVGEELFKLANLDLAKIPESLPESFTPTFNEMFTK